jgi:hypothetical protein
MNRASIAFALALLTSVPALAHARDGFEIGLGLGAATGNFSIDSKEDEADVGAMFELQLGYVWQSGFGVGGGVSSTAFAYTIQVIEEFGGYDNELTLGFTTVELNALYFHPLSKNWELGLRAGVSKTKARFELGDLESDKDSTGVQAAIDAGYFLTDSFALVFGFYYRTFGVAFSGVEDGKELAAGGFELGVRWR